MDVSKSLELGAENIGGQGEEPRGEAGLASPLWQSSPGTNESLLGQLLGSAPIAAVAPGHIDERALPAADDAFKGLNIAGQHAGNVREVWIDLALKLAVGSCNQRRHSPCCRTSRHSDGLHFVRVKQFQTKCNRFPASWVPPITRDKNPCNRFRRILWHILYSRSLRARSIPSLAALACGHFFPSARLRSSESSFHRLRGWTAEGRSAKPSTRQRHFGASPKLPAKEPRRHSRCCVKKTG